MGAWAQAPDGSPETLARHVLHARAIWLVGVMGNRLPPELWTEALGLVASGLSRSDLVLALSSVASLIAMTAGILEDKEVAALVYPVNIYYHFYFL